MTRPIVKVQVLESKPKTLHITGSAKITDSAGAAARGNGKAQYKLGIVYYNGLGVAQDFAKAAKWTVQTQLTRSVPK